MPKKELDIICKVKAGSHLFGTNRPDSDLDYKGVYVPSADDILMGTYKHTIVESTGGYSSKNTKDDIDLELYSLKKFFDMVYVANNHVLELIFAPEEMIVETSDTWEYIRHSASQLVCKKVENYLEYCQSQAAKYGVRGSRVASVKAVLEALKYRPGFMLDEAKNRRPKEKLKDHWEWLKDRLEGIEHVEFFEASESQPIPYIEVNNRKFQQTNPVEGTLQALQKIFDNYGARAKQAEKNEGIDWKALSHAYRVGHQAYELLETGKITLPIPEPHRSYVKKIKNNDKELTVTFDELRPQLEELADNLKKAMKKSSLPDSVDREKWDNFVKRKYSEKVISKYSRADV